MIAAFFMAAAATYSLYGWLTYTMRDRPWYTFACLACALLANLMFIVLTTRLGDARKIFLAGLGWDLMLICVQAALPFFIGAIPLRLATVVGVVMVGTGILLTHWSLQR